MGYEANIYDTKDIIEVVLNDVADPKDIYFGTYVEAKTRVSLGIEIHQILKRGKKRIGNIQKKIDKKDDPLILIEGKGED